MKKLDIMVDCWSFGIVIGFTIYMIVELIAGFIGSSEVSIELALIGLIIASSGTGVVGGRVIVDIIDYKKQLLGGAKKKVKRSKKKAKHAKKKLQKSN